MNKKMLKLFGEAFLKTIIVILGIVIVVFAIYLLIQVFGGGDKQAGGSTSEDTDISSELLATDENFSSENTDEVTEASTEATTEQISSVGHSIEVLNSTDIAGVAKGWQDKLTAAGYTVTQIGNYETEALTSTKIIVTQEGMGQDLVAQFRNATVEVGTISSGVEIQIIIGTEDAQ